MLLILPPSGTVASRFLLVARKSSAIGADALTSRSEEIESLPKVDDAGNYPTTNLDSGFTID